MGQVNQPPATVTEEGPVAHHTQSHIPIPIIQHDQHRFTENESRSTRNGHNESAFLPVQFTSVTGMAPVKSEVELSLLQIEQQIAAVFSLTDIVEQAEYCEKLFLNLHQDIVNRMFLLGKAISWAKERRLYRHVGKHTVWDEQSQQYQQVGPGYANMNEWLAALHIRDNVRFAEQIYEQADFIKEYEMPIALLVEGNGEIPVNPKHLEAVKELRQKTSSAVTTAGKTSKNPSKEEVEAAQKLVRDAKKEEVQAAIWEIFNTLPEDLETRSRTHHGEVTRPLLHLTFRYNEAMQQLEYSGHMSLDEAQRLCHGAKLYFHFEDVDDAIEIRDIPVLLRKPTTSPNPTSSVSSSAQQNRPTSVVDSTIRGQAQYTDDDFNDEYDDDDAEECETF